MTRSLFVKKAAALVVVGMLLWSAPAQARKNRYFSAVELYKLVADYDTFVGYAYDRLDYYNAEGRFDRDEDNFVLGQRLGLAAEGSFVHPDFWSWNALLNALFIVDIAKGDLIDEETIPPQSELAQERYGFEPEFDVGSVFLRKKAVSLSAFAHRHTDIIHRPFQSNNWLTTFMTGAATHWSNEVFPSTVDYSYRRTDGTRDEIASAQEVHQVNVEGENRVDSMINALHYSFVDNSNRFDSNYDFAFHNGSFYNLLPLDAERHTQLKSSLRAYSRSSDHADLSLFEFAERVSSQLIPELESIFLYTLGFWDTSQDDGVRNTASLEFTHRLFESLVSRVYGMISHNYQETQQALNGVLSGGVEYRKDLGPVVMTHEVQLIAGWRAFSADAETFAVIDYPVELVGEAPSILSREDVVTSSLQVVDRSGTLRYLEGQDFELLRSSDVVYLSRLTGGDIPDGATVFVSFVFRVTADASADSLDTLYAVRLETDLWNFLEFFTDYRLRDVQYDVGHGQADITYHHFDVGAESSVENVQLDASYALDISEHYELQTVSLGSHFEIPIQPLFRPTLGFRDLILVQGDGAPTRNLFSASTNVRFPIAEPFFGNWRWSYRWEQGGGNDGHSLIGIAKVDWQVRDVLMWLEYDLDLRLAEMQSHDQHRITLNVRRTF